MSCVNADDGGIKTHTFSENKSVDGFKLEWAWRHTTPHVMDLTGGTFKSLTIRWTKASGRGRDSFLTCEADCVAQTVTDDAAYTSLTLSTKKPFHRHHTLVTLDGNAIPEILSGEITIDRGIDPERDSRYANTTLSQNIGEPTPTEFKITGVFEVLVKDDTYYDLWKAGTKISGANSLAFSKGADDQLLFTFADFFILEGVGSTDFDGPRIVPIAWEAVGTSGPFSSVVSRDNIATY